LKLEDTSSREPEYGKVLPDHPLAVFKLLARVEKMKPRHIPKPPRKRLVVPVLAKEGMTDFEKMLAEGDF